jgi:pyruvate ferredoxin oxidoreductase gamma subunit
VPATELALKHVGRAVPNAALLAGFAAVSGRISLESVIAAIREKFPKKVAEGNVAAANAAHAFVVEEMQEAARAKAG